MTEKHKALQIDYACKIEESKAILEQLEKSKNRCVQYEEKIEKMSDENRRLGIRAAVSFDELTPRFPKFVETFTKLGIPQPKADYKSGSVISSIAYIEALISHFNKNK